MPLQTTLYLLFLSFSTKNETFFGKPQTDSDSAVRADLSSAARPIDPESMARKAPHVKKVPSVSPRRISIDFSPTLCYTLKAALRFRNTQNRGVAHLVERLLWEQEARSSSLRTSTTKMTENEGLSSTFGHFFAILRTLPPLSRKPENFDQLSDHLQFKNHPFPPSNPHSTVLNFSPALWPQVRIIIFTKTLAILNQGFCSLESNLCQQKQQPPCAGARWHRELTAILVARNLKAKRF